jgi:Yippee zinc-binding/DNA-binding /Mis18, centromere assembly
MSLPGGGSIPKILNDFDRARARDAQRLNDAMVYLDGAQIYSCAQCRTHLTSHDDIISKSFHGRHGRAYLFDQCVNVDLGPAEDRLLITGMHSVSDIFCKRCKSLVGWTYNKAYENSQKYKEGKFIIEKINLHLEESDYYQAAPPAGEKTDRWRKRSMSWGSESSPSITQSMVYEYRPSV